MKSRIWSKIIGISFLIVIYVLLWWGLSWFVFLIDYNFSLKGPQFIQLAIIVGFIFGALFTVFVERLIHQETLIQHLPEHIHKILNK